MGRYLVLFAREPGREAREKGFARREAADLFATFASGWLEAARQAGARLVVATPAEDRAAWKRRFRDTRDLLWITQRGRSFGERLREAARCALELDGPVVFVGGDVAPSPEGVAEAFRSLERGAGAVLGPAEDGGVSLVSLREQDLDLLGNMAPRRRDVFSTLWRRLVARGRVVRLVALPPDIDRHGDLRTLARVLPASALRSLVRRALRPIASDLSTRPTAPRSRILANPWGLRAPPVAA